MRTWCCKDTSSSGLVHSAPQRAWKDEDIPNNEWTDQSESEGLLVNKTELIDHVAESADLSKADAARAVDAVISSVTKALKKGDSVTVVGFGTFQVRERAARTGRNPKTGDTINIAASKNPAFKAGKALKDAVN